MSALWHAGIALLLAVQLAGLCAVPFGFPGAWLQVVAALGLVGLGAMRWEWVLGFMALAGVGELIEFWSGQWGARRFGGSPRAAWGGVAGGIAGAVVGSIPVPIIGSLVASFIGTFVGAAAGEMWAQRRLSPNLRVGVGAVLGRVIGVGAKLWCACVILIASIAVVLL